MSLIFTRRYLDAAQFLAYKQFAEFNNELVTWDTGPIANNGQALSSADGITWSQLFAVLGVDVGFCNADDGNGIAVYNGNLFICLYRNSTTEPKVIEYDPVTENVTNHLGNPTAGGNDNVMASDLVVWNRKLWVITDVTTFVSNRRVVYYYDGSSWTAIADYDGASYLDYNRGDGFSPIQSIKHRTSRLFVFNGELYFVATRWSGTGWGWEVWKFDADNYDQFNLLFDSSTLADNFCLSAIVENVAEGKVYLVGNEIQANGNPMNIAKLYSSEDMETWTEESLFPLLEDEFSDASRASGWTDQANNGTITEAANALTLAIAGAVNGDWWQPNLENAPFAKYTPGITELSVVTKLNSYTVNDGTNAGLIIGTTTTIPDNAGGYCYSFVRARSGGTNGLQVVNVGAGALATNAVTTLPVWLRLRISGSGAGSVIKFDYSTDGITWTTLHTLNNATWSFVGLHAKNFGALNAISAPFEYFNIYKSVGWSYGEQFFDGRLYLNCLDVLKVNTWVRYWNEVPDEFTLTQEITTNTNARGGGLSSFLNDLYAGKYKEIYGAPGPVYKQTRTKAKSLIGLEVTSVDKLGNKTVRRYAPIDTRAPTRFYHGMLKSLSSVQRSIDDLTGLFRIADMSAVIDNSAMEFSKILASTEYFKNQVTKLFHMWADEPERLRQHIISLIVEDHSIKGVDFKVKFKDRALAYFEEQIPANITTKSGFTQIFPDVEGEAIPEVLGEATKTTGEDLGAVQALYTDTALFIYLASAGILASIPQVYSDNVLKATPADYSIIVVGGSTYIDFTADQGDNIVSFNAHGYSYGAWDSADGYVQNPAYIILYYLRFILDVPFSMLDVASFDALADIYDNMGVGTSGKLILQQREEAMEILRQLLYSFGAKGFMAKGGKFKVERKDISIYSTDTFIFDQQDALNQAENKRNLTKAMNVSKDRFDYIPWLELFKSAKEYQRSTYPERIERDRRIPYKGPRRGRGGV